MSRIYNNALTPAELKTLERLQQKQRKYTRDEAAFWRQVDERHDEIIAQIITPWQKACHIELPPDDVRDIKHSLITCVANANTR